MAFYTTVPSDLQDFLSKVPQFGVPSSVDAQWLAQVGFATSNQRSILNVLRAIDAIDDDGKPTEVWSAIRSKNRKGIGQAIRNAYADLFSTFSDPHKKDDEAIANFYRASTTYSSATLQRVIRTFRVLTEIADLDASEPSAGSSSSSKEKKDDEKGAGTKEAPLLPPTQAPVHLTVNIQLQLPATAEGKVYEQLFRAMRENLIDLVDQS